MQSQVSQFTTGHTDVPSWMSWPAQGIYLAQVKDTENRGQKESPDVISSLYASGRRGDELGEE